MVRKGTRKVPQKETGVDQSENVESSAPVKVKSIKKMAGSENENANPPKPIEETNRKRSLINLFDKIQLGKLTDENALSILTHLYSQATGSTQHKENVLDNSSNGFNEGTFSKMLSEIMVQNFAIAVKSVPVERTIKIFAAFVCHCLHHELEFVDTFTWLVNEFHDDVCKSFRLRVCQVVLAVMSKCANDEIELTDKLWKVMRDALIVRSRDKMAEVRLVAVRALIYFQPRLGEEDDSEDSDNEGQPRKLENDPVVRQLAYLLEFEQSAEIRKVVLESLQINNTTLLKCIIRHCRDVDVSCRAAALNSVAHSVSIKALSSQQRVDILTIAFRNSGAAPLMDKAVKNLVNGWLSQVGGQIPDLLILIDPVCYSELCGKLLKTILASVPIQQAVDSIDILDDRKLLGDEHCKPEYIFWWVSVLKFLKEMNQTDLFDSLSPNVTAFAQYIAHHFKRVKETKDDDEVIVRTFVNQQLLEIAAILDYSMDEFGRKNMARVLEAHLKDSSSNEYSRLVKQEMEVLLKLLGKQRFIHTCLDAISELRFPIGGTSSDDIQINNTKLTDVSKRAGETTNCENKVEDIAGGDTANPSDDVMEDVAPCAPVVDENLLKEMQYKAAQIRVEIHKQRDVLDECVAQQNFIKAQEEKEKLVRLEAELRNQQIEISNLKTGGASTSNPTGEPGSSNEGAPNEADGDGAANEEKNMGEERVGDVNEEHSAKAVAGISDSQESRSECIHCRSGRWFDHVAVFQWLSIAHRIPQMVFFNTFPMALIELRNCLVSRLATSVDAVRLKTVQCVGVYSMFDRDYATQMLPLIVQVLIMDRKESVQITAFRTLMDLLLRYGVTIAGDQLTQESFVESGLMDLTSLNDTFLNHVPIVDNSSTNIPSTPSVPNNSKVPGSTATAPWMGDETESSNSACLVKLVVKYLDNVMPEMRCVAAEGLAKLLLHDRIDSPDIFARLCILWFSPTSKHDMYLRQCLGHFFPLFAVKSAQHQECVRRAFLPIIRTIFKAPLTSPLAMIDCKLLVQYLVTLTSPCNEKLMQHDVTALDIVKKAAVHEKLGKQLCEEILNNPDELYVGTLVIALKHIHLEEDSTILSLSQFFDYLTQIHLNVDLGANKKELSRIRNKISGQLNITTSSSQASKPSTESDNDGVSSQNSSHMRSASRILQASVLLNQSTVDSTPALLDFSNNKTMILQTPRVKIDSSDNHHLGNVSEEVSTAVATSPLADISETSNTTVEQVESPRKRKKRAANARQGKQAAK